MHINIGTKIKELRKRDGRTQEAMAAALGVTAQAISRWEANGGYPDMELIPSVANYFGITIDELFGYECERQSKIDDLARSVHEKTSSTTAPTYALTNVSPRRDADSSSFRRTNSACFAWRRCCIPPDIQSTASIT